MTNEQRARLEDAARYPMLAKMEDVKAALAHIDALEARVTHLTEAAGPMGCKPFTLGSVCPCRLCVLERKADALAAERDAAKAERLASERQHYDDVARLEAERAALREALGGVRDAINTHLSLCVSRPDWGLQAARERIRAALTPTKEEK